MIFAEGFCLAIRRIVCRAPWSALAVTEQVFTITTSACSTPAASAPFRRSCASSWSESAWFTRQPKVTMENFTAYLLSPNSKSNSFWSFKFEVWNLRRDLRRRSFDLFGQFPFVVDETLRDRRICHGQDLGGEDAGVSGARFTDRDGRDGNARRHLDGGEQRVHSLQRR